MIFLRTYFKCFVNPCKTKLLSLWRYSFAGIGFGSFQSVDFALVMDILPEEKDKAKDIAVWHLALILPNALATPVGGLILDYFESVNCRIGLGYIILFVVTTVYFLLSGIFVTRIRQAK